MADAVGILSKFAFIKDRGLFGAGPSIVYPDNTAKGSLGATHMVPFASESMSRAIERAKHSALVGSGQVTPSDVIADASAGGTEGQLTWEGHQRVFMCGMGFEHPDSPNPAGIGSPATLAVGAYAHLFERDDVLAIEAWRASELGGYVPPSVNDRKVRSGAFGTCKQLNDWAWNNSMVNKITFTGTPNEVKVSYEFVSYNLQRGSYGSASWTLPAGSGALSLFQQAVIKGGLRSGGAGGLSTFRPSGWELVIDNKLKADDRSTGSAPYIEEPLRSDFRECTLKLEFPRHDALTESLFTSYENDVEYATSIVLTGPQIAATGFNHTWEFYMSSLAFKNPQAPVSGAGPLTFSVEFDAHKPGGSDIFDAGSYHGITTVKDSELVVVVNDSFLTNYLLER